LFEPVPNRLVAKVELVGQFVDAAACTDQIEDLTPELGRVCPGVLFACHRWTFLRQAESIHETGPASLKAAIATVFQGASWQRCKVHFFRNILAHVPQARKLEVAAGLRTVFAQVSLEAAQRAAGEFRALFAKTLTKALAIFDAGLADVLAFLRFPLDHHRKIASTNPIEHLNREIRRRTRSIGIFPSRESALRLVTMILIEQSEDWMVERRYMTPESLALALQI